MTCTGQNYNAEDANLCLCVNYELSQYTCRSTVLVKYINVCYIDIDECKGLSLCDGNAQCTNTIGSFTCACNEGYSGNGMTCTGQNFNAEDSNLCLCVTFMHASAPVRTLE